MLSASDVALICCEALQVQRELGIKQAISFDVTAACSGFVVALITASQFIQSGSRKNILVIGADALSRYVDWNDRGKSFQSSFASQLWYWHDR